jgi:CRISPR/Cas system-associated endonuclease/helicase Cas3
MWNYRVVRKKTVCKDSSSKKDRIDYTYAIHEAYYDKNGFAGAITRDPIEPFGETIQELRHSWVMMAEAFGKPILDYEMIPEPGYSREDDPLGLEFEKREKEFESGEVKGIPWEQVKKEIEEKWGPVDEDVYRKQVEEERIEKEQAHNDTFVSKSEFEDLFMKLFKDYREYIKQDLAENPWKYRRDDGEQPESGLSSGKHITGTTGTGKC